MKSGQLLPATGEFEVLSRITPTRACSGISGLDHLRVDHTASGLARQNGKLRPARALGCNAKGDRQEGARRYEMPKEVIVELVHTSSHSCAAGRRFSVAASGEEAVAAGPAAVAPEDVALAAISEDLYLGSLT